MGSCISPATCSCTQSSQHVASARQRLADRQPASARRHASKAACWQRRSDAKRNATHRAVFVFVCLEVVDTPCPDFDVASLTVVHVVGNRSEEARAIPCNRLSPFPEFCQVRVLLQRDAVRMGRTADGSIRAHSPTLATWQLQRARSATTKRCLPAALPVFTPVRVKCPHPVSSVNRTHASLLNRQAAKRPLWGVQPTTREREREREREAQTHKRPPLAHPTAGARENTPAAVAWGRAAASDGYNTIDCRALRSMVNLRVPGRILARLYDIMYWRSFQRGRQTCT